MRVGSIVFATEQGLGYLAKDFFDNGVVTDVLVVDHGKRPMQHWYPGASVISHTDVASMKAFCRQLNTLLVFETCWQWALIDYCRSIGVRTALMPMHECTPYPYPAKFDVVLCPSLVERDGVHMVVPYNWKWRLRTKARIFVHNSGNGGLHGRNGTKEFMRALELVRTPCHVVVRSQGPEVLFAMPPVCTYEFECNCPREELYDVGDVFVFPEKFNGLSLPLQEAQAAGMLVMATQRFPNDTYLPSEPLIPAERFQRSRLGGHLPWFDEAIVTPKAIAAIMDAWYDKDITKFSEQGRDHAAERSWAKLKPRYMELLCS